MFFLLSKLLGYGFCCTVQHEKYLMKGCLKSDFFQLPGMEQVQKIT